MGGNGGEICGGFGEEERRRCGPIGGVGEERPDHRIELERREGVGKIGEGGGLGLFEAFILCEQY